MNPALLHLHIYIHFFLIHAAAVQELRYIHICKLLHSCNESTYCKAYASLKHLRHNLTVCQLFMLLQ